MRLIIMEINSKENRNSAHHFFLTLIKYSPQNTDEGIIN